MQQKKQFWSIFSPLTNFVISGCGAKTGQISLQDDNRGQLDKDKLVEAFPPS